MSTIAAANSSATNAVASLLSNAAGSTVESDKAVSKQTGRAVTLASDDPKVKPSNEPSVVVTLVCRSGYRNDEWFGSAIALRCCQQ
jgi:hypothetical protein